MCHVVLGWFEELMAKVPTSGQAKQAPFAYFFGSVPAASRTSYV
jgi:hypothetical protein